MTITTFIVSLTSNPFFVLVGFIVGFLSFIGMIYFYRRGKEEKIPCYFIKTTNIFHDLNKKFDALRVSYNEEKIDNLTVTTLFFWNSGKKTIRDVDIAPNDPLVVKIKEGCKILNIKVLNENCKKNNFKISLAPDSLSAKLVFDYIDENEGMVVQITHNGDSSHDIKLYGTIIGTKELIEKNISSPLLSSTLIRLLVYFGILENYPRPRTHISPTHMKRAISFALVFGGTVYIVMSIFVWLSISGIIPVPTNDEPDVVETNIFLALSFIMGLSLVFIGLYELKRNVPKDFQAFYDELEF